MITEDYCSFEISKLLKEKGFDEPCRAYWDDQPLLGTRTLFWTVEPHKYYGREVSGPTHQTAMKWLREVHKICIEPYAATECFGWTICHLPSGSHICNELDYKDLPELGFQTWEEAIEAALKYALENLLTN